MPGIIATLFGAKEAVKQVPKTIDSLGNLFDKVFTSKEEKLTHIEVMERIKQRPTEFQHELNLLEAQHKSIFVAGWRPSIGWVCSVSLGFYFIPQFAMAAYLWTIQSYEQGILLPYPNAGAESLFELVLAMLGMAGLRTFEKLKGVTK